MNEDCLYSVWVGGVEVNDHLLTEEEACLLAEEYEDDGHDDVGVERVGINSCRF